MTTQTGAWAASRNDDDDDLACERGAHPDEDGPLLDINGKTVSRRLLDFLISAGNQTLSLRRAARRALVLTTESSLPIDITSVAQQLGLSVWTHRDIMDEDLPDCVWGFVYDGKACDAVVTNGSKNAAEQRITVAHEIGEWWLGHERQHLRRPSGITLIAANDYENGTISLQMTEELRADIFGLELLMPAPLFMAEMAKNPDVSHLSRVFGVSPIIALTKAWLHGVNPFATLDLTHMQRQTDERTGPWAKLLYARFYRVAPLESTYHMEDLLRFRESQRGEAA